MPEQTLAPREALGVEGIAVFIGHPVGGAHWIGVSHTYVDWLGAQGESEGLLEAVSLGAQSPFPCQLSGALHPP